MTFNVCLIRNFRFNIFLSTPQFVPDVCLQSSAVKHFARDQPLRSVPAFSDIVPLALLCSVGVMWYCSTTARLTAGSAVLTYSIRPAFVFGSSGYFTTLFQLLTLRKVEWSWVLNREKCDKQSWPTFKFTSEFSVVTVEKYENMTAVPRSESEPSIFDLSCCGNLLGRAY
jgi:hypothetical protein